MGVIRFALKKNPYTSRPYSALKHVKDEAFRMTVTSGIHRFDNRSKGSDQLCIILAGYKEPVYPAVFGRIANAVLPDMDVCVLSSGVYSPVLDQLCQERSWSYLSTRRNNVSLIQNMAIELHPCARYIFKLDEDVFICQGYFERMLNAYHHASKGMYRPGVIAPLLNLNGFCSYLLLKRLGLLQDFQTRFEPLHSATGREYPVERLPEVARYLWGEGGIIPSIDTIDKMLAADEQREVACPHMFSIGAILFERQLWEDMEYFPVKLYGVSLGKDEKRICSFCHAKSRPLMVSMNIAAGHLSFRPQNATMMDYYTNHKELFLPKDAGASANVLNIDHCSGL